jgi:hypothetical protein
MNTTHIPGFTAEASLYELGKHYHAVSIENTDSSRIVPQLSKRNDPALACLEFCFCCGRYANSYCCILCDICTEIYSRGGIVASPQ